MLVVCRNEAETKLKAFDGEYHEFFKSVYLRKEVSPDEFDLTINMDYITSENQVARIIACAFGQKFGLNFKNE